MSAKDTKGWGYRGDIIEKATTNLIEQVHKLQDGSETNSHKWEGLSKVSSEDKQVDVVHSYHSIRIYDEGKSLGSRPLEQDS